VRILALRLPTRRPHELRRFYAEELGLPRHGYDVHGGGTTLTFVGGQPRSPFHFAFNIPENRLDDAKAWLEPRVRLLARDGTDTFNFEFWDAHAVYFNDPAGNVVELIARHRLASASDARFDGGSLLEVSELGLPTPDVAGTVEFLERELGVPVFSGDRTTFAAVGDERGLFIVVPEGRPWFPTDVAAWPSRLDVAVAAARDAVLEVPGTPYRILARAG
jgi:catechol-2,3-dioxygenase